MRKSNKLTVAFVRTAPKGMHSDGANLYLNVDTEGRKRWIFRYVFSNRQRDLGLGSASLVTLAEAREAAFEARRQLAQGKDPLAEKLAKKADRKTFGEAADDFIKAMAPKWRSTAHDRQWRLSMDSYCKPLRAMDVEKIETRHVYDILKPIWREKFPTASRIRGRIEQVLFAARAKGHIKGVWQNPASWLGNLDHLLGEHAKAPPKHHTALSFEDVPDFMAALKDRRANAALALRLIILTAARAGEVLNAKADEFDLTAKTWTIPAHRMKANRQHRVPLSAGAVEVVQDLLLLNGEWLVPGARRGRPLTSEACLKLAERMGFDTTTHGLRSSFRDWCGEVTSFPRELVEESLAHAIGSDVERAYRRRDSLERRRALMEAWGSYCVSNPADKVVPIKVTA
ncbi:integrase [Labrys miyagiensis]